MKNIPEGVIAAIGAVRMIWKNCEERSVCWSIHCTIDRMWLVYQVERIVYSADDECDIVGMDMETKKKLFQNVDGHRMPLYTIYNTISEAAVQQQQQYEQQQGAHLYTDEI